MRGLRQLIAVVTVFVALTLSASAATIVVEMQQVGPSFQFVPQQLVIHRGDIVEWRNQTAVSHTSTSGTGSGDPQSGLRWNSGIVSPGGTFQYAFTALGTYPYYCIPHEFAGMTGQITVIAEVPATDTYGKYALIALLLAFGAFVVWRRRAALSRTPLRV